jgi:hypothetical protein
MLSGCKIGPTTYEIFEMHRNYAIGDSFVLRWGEESREIYSDDKYIYISEYPKGCIYGYFTNKDGKPEKIIGWIILSGEENCKLQQSYAFLF